MTTAVQNNPSPNAEIKARQQAVWASGDYAAIGATLQITGELICEGADVRAGQRVLDVAAGNGNATLAAARRGADVTSTDYVPALLERGRRRAEADGLTIAFKEADVEALPFADASFERVLSTFGAMFAPDHAQTAREMLRVCTPGGKIGVASWTPQGFIGQYFKVTSTHVPPMPGVKSPLLWGTDAHIRDIFPGVARIEHTTRHFLFKYRSPEHFVETFRAYYGPTLRAFASLDRARQEALSADLIALLRRMNVSGSDDLVVPGEYLETVITK